LKVADKSFIEKMERELAKAKQAKSDEELRGYMFAVKALAELIIEAGRPQGKMKDRSPVKVPDANTLAEEDANGDSIFDF
jgi:hypothetical protein